MLVFGCRWLLHSQTYSLRQICGAQIHRRWQKGCRYMMQSFANYWLDSMATKSKLKATRSWRRFTLLLVRAFAMMCINEGVFGRSFFPRTQNTVIGFSHAVLMWCLPPLYMLRKSHFLAQLAGIPPRKVRHFQMHNQQPEHLYWTKKEWMNSTLFCNQDATIYRLQ